MTEKEQACEREVYRAMLDAVGVGREQEHHYKPQGKADGDSIRWDGTRWRRFTLDQGGQCVYLD